MTREIRNGSRSADADRQARRTPPRLIAALEFLLDAPVVLDAAATIDNAICEHYIQPPWEDENPRAVARDALTVEWSAAAWRLPRGLIWCNPPFSSFPAFSEKAINARDENRRVVMIGPISTDTRWFLRLWACGVQVRALHRRLNFLPPVGADVKSKSGVSFPTALYFFEPDCILSTFGVIELVDDRLVHR